MRPDGRHLANTRLSGAPLSSAEIDYDELEIHRAWRAWDADEAGAVRYFMYELGQKNPGDQNPVVFYKAVRFLRLTRVPRWLRQQGSGTGRAEFSQMAYILAALREQGILFTQLIAKTPEIPLIYAYGVQAVAATPEEAQQMADEAYGALSRMLDGVFQQIEYAPIKMEEGEALARYQATWRNVAVARGRPIPNSQPIGSAAVLDGNSSDIESTHNQMESFIRGLSESRKGFMLTLVTVPLRVTDMTLAWRNISSKLSELRSDTYGTKSFTAGVAIPLSVGSSAGTGHSDSHSTSASNTAGTSQSSSVSDGYSRSQSLSVGDSHTHSQGASLSNTIGASTTQSHGAGQSLSDGYSHGVNTGQSSSAGVNSSQSNSMGVSQSDGLTAGRSLSAGQSVGSNSSQSMSDSYGASLSRTDGFSQSHGTSLSQSLGHNGSLGDSWSNANSNQTGSNVSGAPFGFGGGANTSSGLTNTTGGSSGSGFSNSLSGGWNNSLGTSSSMGQGLSQTQTQGASIGSSQTQSLTDSNSLSQSHTLGASSTMGVGQGQSFTNGSSIGESAGLSRSLGSNISQSLSAGHSQSQALGSSESLSAATNRSFGSSAGTSSSTGLSQGASQSAALADAYAVAMSRNASTTGSMGVVPSFGVSVAKQTLDVAKRELGDILETQLRRYTDGVEGGAFLYQMFLVAEDRETLMGGAALLKAAFWAPGTDERRLAQPFHLITDFSSEPDPEGEVSRLIEHARAFTSYRRREPVIEIIEPFRYSSYVTVGELSALCRPPTVEGPGLLAVHDSAPVLAMPADRQNRELTIGRLFNGERAKVSELRWGIDSDELTHVLVSGTTGSGKTTMLNRMLAELTQVTRTIAPSPVPGEIPDPPRIVYPSILALDWMANMRHLGSLVDPVTVDATTGEKKGRFQLFSVSDPSLGKFAWNPLAIPDPKVTPSSWLQAMADNMVASWGLQDMGRSILAEAMDSLYRASRLEPFTLMGELTDELGNIRRPAIVLEPVDRSTLPPDAIGVDAITGEEVANVYTCPELSRLVGVQHLAIMIAAQVEAAATVEGGRQGTSMRDRLQSVWRRIMYFVPDGQLGDMLLHDPDLNTSVCLTIDDLVDPDRGLVTVIETDGLDLANRRLILGSLMLAVYRAGLARGEGCFNQHGKGVGLFLVLEEAHEIFGSTGDEEDRFSVSTRTALFESMHRRIRALGARMIDVVQNPGDVPEAITSNINTVFILRSTAKPDRDRIFSLLNWSNMIGQQLREYRWLGEMPVGYCIARLHAKTSYLESAPVQIVVEPPAMGKITDAQLATWAAQRTR